MELLLFVHRTHHGKQVDSWKCFIFQRKKAFKLTSENSRESLNAVDRGEDVFHVHRVDFVRWKVSKIEILENLKIFSKSHIRKATALRGQAALPRRFWCIRPPRAFQSANKSIIVNFIFSKINILNFLTYQLLNTDSLEGGFELEIEIFDFDARSADNVHQNRFGKPSGKQ